MRFYKFLQNHFKTIIEKLQAILEKVNIDSGFCFWTIRRVVLIANSIKIVYFSKHLSSQPRGVSFEICSGDDVCKIEKIVKSYEGA